MPNYLSYGLRIQSNQPIFGLVETTATSPNVDIHLGDMPSWATSSGKILRYASPYKDPSGNPELIVWTLIDCQALLFSYWDGAEFLIAANGRNIWATWPEHLSPEYIATYLQSTILGFVLRFHGIPALHGSAVALGGTAIAFVGQSGAGKSTLAAGFGMRGYPVLADDIVPMVDRDQRYMAVPGYPHIRLWDSSVQMLFGAFDALPMLAPDWDKRYLDLTQSQCQFQQEALPFGAVYLVEQRQPDLIKPCIEELPPAEALIILSAHTYGVSLLDKAMRAQEFAFLSRFVESVTVKRMTPPADPAYLPNTFDTIVQDVHFMTAS